MWPSALTPPRHVHQGLLLRVLGSPELGRHHMLQCPAADGTEWPCKEPQPFPGCCPLCGQSPSRQTAVPEPRSSSPIFRGPTVVVPKPVLSQSRECAPRTPRQRASRSSSNSWPASTIRFSHQPQSPTPSSPAERVTTARGKARPPNEDLLRLPETSLHGSTVEGCGLLLSRCIRQFGYRHYVTQWIDRLLRSQSCLSFPFGTRAHHQFHVSCSFGDVPYCRTGEKMLEWETPPMDVRCLETANYKRTHRKGRRVSASSVRNRLEFAEPDARLTVFNDVKTSLVQW